MNTDGDARACSSLALVRLMQLISPSLPIGGFTYSQGLERAVDNGWVGNAAELQDWIAELIHSSLEKLDLPILIRLYDAAHDADFDKMQTWSDFLLASRETSELRLEESNRGRALSGLLNALGLLDNSQWQRQLAGCQSAGFAFAACRWHIDKHDMLLGFAWNWLENLVLAGVKIIPLGQSDGQRLLRDLGSLLPDAVSRAERLDDDEIGASNPAMTIASCQHQFQYTRLFRS